MCHDCDGVDSNQSNSKEVKRNEAKRNEARKNEARRNVAKRNEVDFDSSVIISWLIQKNKVIKYW